MRASAAMVAVAGAFLITPLHSGRFCPGIGDLLAVTPPSAESRHKAEAGRQEDVKGKARAQRESGCAHGRDRKTGECYEPREGQFYRDPKTGDVKRKKTECYNLPWKPCK